MRGEDVVVLFENKVLRNYLCVSAKNFSRNPELQEDLLQEAWLRICEKPAGRDIKFYIHEGFLAMNSFYRKELRQRKIKQKSRYQNIYRVKNKIKRM